MNFACFYSSFFRWPLKMILKYNNLFSNGTFAFLNYYFFKKKVVRLNGGFVIMEINVLQCTLYEPRNILTIVKKCFVKKCF